MKSKPISYSKSDQAKLKHKFNKPKVTQL